MTPGEEDEVRDGCGLLVLVIAAVLVGTVLGVILYQFIKTP